MKPKFTFNLWIKVCIAFLLALNLIMTLDRPTIASSDHTTIWPSETLYRQAVSWEIYKGDYIHAALYMFAYVQRNPPEYANDIYRKTDADARLQKYLDSTNASVTLLNSCGQASGDGQFNKVTPTPPPDAALVCTKPQYQGVCRLLFVGDYSSYKLMGVPNDDISSVKVGSRVKLILYQHSLSHPEYTVITSDDPDLSDNRIIGTNNFWDNRTSSAKVQYR